MKKVVSLLALLVLLLNVSLGYTLTITYNEKETTRDVEGGETVIVGLSSRENANYTVDSNNAVLKVYGNRRQFVMPEEDVNITITLKEEAESSSTVDVLSMQVGDYVEYTPSATTVDLTTITGVEQDAFKPSQTTAWRVLSNDGMTVELVSAESVGMLTLGAEATRETDGTYSAGSAEAEELTKVNYAEIGRILREISEAYVDEEVATGGRGLGFKEGSSAEEIDTTMYPITWENTYTNGNNGFPYTDEYYSDDVTALTNNNMLHSSGYVWLASRDLDVGSNRSGFNVRGVDSDGDVSYGSLFYERSDGSAYSYSSAVGVRPVVSLKSGIKITGAGTEVSPWKIN